MILVLGYHTVSSSWDDSLAVGEAALERQLVYLIDQGWRGTTFANATQNRPAGKTLVVTFDDAYDATLTRAQPILDRLSIPATVFVPTDYITRGKRFAWAGVRHWLETDHAAELSPLGWHDLAALQSLGWEVGSHTCSHPRLTQLDDRTLRTELQESREEQKARLGTPSQTIAYPFGDVDHRVATAAREAGYVAGAAPWNRISPMDPFLWPRIGIYRKDTFHRFRLKISWLGRHLLPTDL